MADTRPCIQIGRSGLVHDGGADMRQIATHFARTHVVLVPRFLDADLLVSVRQLIGRSKFVDYSHGRFGAELCLPDEAPAVALLHLVLNDPKLFGLVEAITGCPSIGCFTGRVYRMVPGAGHYDDWHTDALGSRLVGLSVNVS